MDITMTRGRKKLLIASDEEKLEYMGSTIFNQNCDRGKNKKFVLYAIDVNRDFSKVTVETFESLFKEGSIFISALVRWALIVNVPRK